MGHAPLLDAVMIPQTVYAVREIAQVVAAMNSLNAPRALAHQSDLLGYH
jgi:hypothetical protein